MKAMNEEKYGSRIPKVQHIVVHFCFGLLFILVVSCTVKSPIISNKDFIKNNYINSKSLAIYEGIHDTSFVRLSNYEGMFVFEMKYASNDNFLKTQVYDCDECYLRMKTVRNLIEANNEFLQMGYRIKIYDCYRPLDIQKKMWTIMPDADYVADPKRGSIHNRGGAVDITLVDQNGVELEMGTPFDHFGPESAHAYKKLPYSVKMNRALLKEVMLRHNFRAFKSEWWHYNLAESIKDPLANFKWNCH
jgi:D-alanyl-D-alanine dipeptidase